MIEPTSVEGYLIQICGKLEGMDVRISNVESNIKSLCVDTQSIAVKADDRLRCLETGFAVSQQSSKTTRGIYSVMQPFALIVFGAVVSGLTWISVHVIRGSP